MTYTQIATMAMAHDLHTNSNDDSGLCLTTQIIVIRVSNRDDSGLWLYTQTVILAYD